MTTTVTITASGAGSATVPANVYEMTFTVWGAGAGGDGVGSGGPNGTGDGGSGSGGGCSVTTLPVMPGQTFYWSVGEAGGGFTGKAGNGGATWVNTITNAAPTGPSQGCHASPGSVEGGASGTGTYGNVANYTGGDGQDAGGAYGCGGGGGAGSGCNGQNAVGMNYGSGGTPDGGNGGQGSTTANGGNAVQPGGGGGGTTFAGGTGGGGGGGMFAYSYAVEWPATATLAAGATLAASAFPAQFGSATLAASAAVAPAARHTPVGVAVLAAYAAVSAYYVSTNVWPATALLAAAGALAPPAAPLYVAGSAGLTASGGLTVAAPALLLSGVSAIIAHAYFYEHDTGPEQFGAAVLAGAAALTGDPVVVKFPAVAAVDPTAGYAASTYASLITSEHNQKPNFMALVGGFLAPFADVTRFLLDLPAQFDLDVAIGAQLDVVGEWVGQTRYLAEPLTDVYFSLGVAGLGFGRGYWEGPYDPTTGLVALPDEPYRTLLRATIAANRWDGTIPGAYAAWGTLFDAAGIQILIQDYGDLSMTLALIGNPPDAATTALFTGGYLRLKPVTVRINAYVTETVPDVPLFGLGVENTSIAGFGGGAWGSFTPGS